MTQKSNGLEKFWQELQRRKVFKVTVMYAGTAFIILQLFDIIAQPLQLPAWTMTLVIVLLCIGFIITLLIAWVYDITPEGIQKTESVGTTRKRKSQVVPVKKGISGSNIIITVMAVFIAVLLYPKIFNRDKLRNIKDADGRISIAIMPFQNMTNDTTWNVWQDGIQDMLINSLSNSPEELKVRQTETTNNLIQSEGLTNNASITPTVASSLSQKLDANVFIYGNLKQAGSILRISAQLIESKTKEVFKSFQVEGVSQEEKLFKVIDSLSALIKDYLIITRLKKETTPDFQNLASTTLPEAYRYFIQGENARRKSDDPAAARFYSQAIAVDSSFYLAILRLSSAYSNQGLYDQSREWCLKLYNIRDQLPLQLKISSEHQYALNFETPYEEIKCLRQLLEIDNQSPTTYYLLGFAYNRLNQFDNAIPEFEKALEIYKKWNTKPYRAVNYILLGSAYHKTGEFSKEKQLYKKAEMDFPDNPFIKGRQAVLSLMGDENMEADQFLEKYISIRKENSVSESDIIQELAAIYDEAGKLEKAEEFYRQALALEPENPTYLNNLAYFIYKNDTDINEGVILIDRAMQMRPDDWLFLATKGELRYKQGRHEEALELLEKSWKLKPVYNHEIYLDIQAAKKALDIQ